MNPLQRIPKSFIPHLNQYNKSKLFRQMRAMFNVNACMFTGLETEYGTQVSWLHLAIVHQITLEIQL